jgi:hypothetical protein
MSENHTLPIPLSIAQSRLRDGGTAVSLADFEPFQAGFWIDSHPKGGRDLIGRHVLIPFDQRRVRDVPALSGTEEGETHRGEKCVQACLVSMGDSLPEILGRSVKTGVI